jgi:PAS domain S-box-containing protein
MSPEGAVGGHSRAYQQEPDLKYRDLLEGAGAAILAVDLEGRFIYVNARGQELLGRTPDELIGRHFTEILPPDHVEIAQSLFQRRRQTRPPIMQVTRKDGSTATVEVSGSWVSRLGRRVAALAMAWEVGVGEAAAEPPAGQPLSTLDMTILKLVSNGLSNREIAERVYLSTHTIKDRIEKIMRYFGVSRRAELAAKAARQGLV